MSLHWPKAKLALGHGIPLHLHAHFSADSSSKILEPAGKKPFFIGLKPPDTGLVKSQPSDKTTLKR